MYGFPRPSFRAVRSLCAALLLPLSVSAIAQSPWKIVELKAPEGGATVTPTSVDRLRNVYGMVQMQVGAIRPARWMAATGYKPEFVGTEDGRIFASNSKGGFAGILENVEGSLGKPTLWAPDGTYTFMDGFPAYRRGEATGLNQFNVAAGSLITQDFAWRAFRWKAGEAVVIPALGDFPYAFGTGISDAGFVVGYGLDNYNPPTKMAGWFWSPTGGLRKLPSVGGWYKPTGINNTGLIVGSARIQSINNAVVWPLFGQPELLFPLAGYQHAEATAVNDLGMIAGNAWTGKWNVRQSMHPVIWFEGNCHDIQAEAGLPGVVYGLVRGVNNKGDVVGNASFEGRASGFLAIRRIL